MYDELHSQVAHAAAGTNAVDQVDNLMPKFWANHQVPPNEEAIDAELRKINHDNPMQLEASRGEFRSRVANWQFTRQQGNEQAEQAAAADIASGKSLAYLQRQPYWNSLLGTSKLSMTQQATNFTEQSLNRGMSAAGRAGNLDPEIVAYAMQAHGLPEHQARALAALVVGEGGQLDNVNQDGGGHGAYGLFQLRDSGGLQDMRKLYGDHPTMQQQVDYFLQHYSKGNNGFWNAGDEYSAFNALASGQRAAEGTQGIINRGGAALSASIGAKTMGQAQAEQWIANPGALGPPTPENTQRIVNTVGQYWAPKVIQAQKAWQGQATKAAMPSAAEVSGTLGQLGISIKASDPDTVSLRANVRSALNTALLAATQQGQRQLTPQERQEVIQKAAAVQVQEHRFLESVRGMGTSSLLTVKRKDFSSIEIPQDERGRAAQGMAAMYKQTKSPRYAPSDENLRQYYLTAHGLMQVPNGH